jgi:hypothetical protein
MEQEGVMKDKSLKDEIKYDVQFFDDYIPAWINIDVSESKKEAKCFVRDYKKFDKEDGLKFKYRIIKLTIKKEVVK